MLKKQTVVDELIWLTSTIEVAFSASEAFGDLITITEEDFLKIIYNIKKKTLIQNFNYN